MLDRSSIKNYVYNMNKLPIEKKIQVINLLVEGNSIRATSRIANVDKETVMKLLCKVGAACQKFHDQTVTNVNSRRVQCDEIWQYIYCKDANIPDNMKASNATPDMMTIRPTIRIKRQRGEFLSRGKHTAHLR